MIEDTDHVKVGGREQFGSQQVEEVSGVAQMLPEPRRQRARSMQLLSALQIGLGVIAARGSTPIPGLIDHGGYFVLGSSCITTAERQVSLDIGQSRRRQGNQRHV